MKPEQVMMPLTVAAAVATLYVVTRPKAPPPPIVQRSNYPMFPLSDYASQADRPGVNFGQNQTYVQQAGLYPLDMSAGPGTINLNPAVDPTYYLWWNFTPWSGPFGPNGVPGQASTGGNGGCGCGCGGSGGCGSAGNCAASFPDGAGQQLAALGALAAGVM